MRHGSPPTLRAVDLATRSVSEGQCSPSLTLRVVICPVILNTALNQQPACVGGSKTGKLKLTCQFATSIRR